MTKQYNKMNKKEIEKKVAVIVMILSSICFIIALKMTNDSFFMVMSILFSLIAIGIHFLEGE